MYLAKINDSLSRRFADSILVAIFTALLRPCRSVSSIKDGCYSVQVNLPECRTSPRVRRRCRNRAVSTLESVANRPRPKPTACRSLSLSLPLASAFALALSYSLTLWVGWLWVAGSYATGIDIPGGQTVNSRLVRTESVVGLHNMVVPLFHPPPPPTIPPAPPTSSARGYERRTLPPGRRVSSCKVVATFWD